MSPISPQLTYSLHGHGWMLSKKARTASYVEALRRVVKPGDVVLDIGTGVGTWAAAACRFGARRVFAVDPSAVIEVGRELAAANGLADRIEFIQAASTDITLPERADVIVQEIHGVLPMSGASLATLIDARTRLLAPGGTMVPRHETLWAALVDCPELYAPHDRPWGSSDHGFTLEPVRAAFTNYWLKWPVHAESIVETPQTWAAIDYGTLDDPNVRGTVTWPITRRSTLHGVALWFDAVLTEGVGFSNAPDVPDLPFGQAFFPFLQPVDVTPGDSVRIDLVARLLDQEYLWYWAISVTDRNGASRVRLQQSDFWHDAIPSGLTRRASEGYIAQPNPERRIDVRILDGLSRGATVEDIAADISREFGGRFADEAATRDRVLTLASAYGLNPADHNR